MNMEVRDIRLSQDALGRMYIDQDWPQFVLIDQAFLADLEAWADPERARISSDQVAFFAENGRATYRYVGLNATEYRTLWEKVKSDYDPEMRMAV